MYLERISADSGNKLTSTEFNYKFQTRFFHLTLAAPEHEEMTLQVTAAWKLLRPIEYSRMVHATVLEAYINFALIYMIDHIFPILPIK